MAQMVPETLPDSATRGERTVFEVLRQLPHDVIVYYEPAIRRRYPDFVLILPTIGVIVIEVKGIPLKAVTEVDWHHIRYLHGGHPQQQQHPSRQARDYMNRLMDKCRDNPAAAELTEKGRFRFAFGHLAVLTAISRGNLDASPWGRLFPDGGTLCSDELGAATESPAILLKRLAGAVYPEIPIKPLSATTVSRLRSILSATAPVPAGRGRVGRTAETSSLELLDLEQERAARQIGDGHRIIYGAPGTGKTIILLAMARLLGKAGARTLFLC